MALNKSTDRKNVLIFEYVNMYQLNHLLQKLNYILITFIFVKLKKNHNHFSKCNPALCFISSTLLKGGNKKQRVLCCCCYSRHGRIEVISRACIFSETCPFICSRSSLLSFAFSQLSLLILSSPSSYSRDPCSAQPGR